MMGAGGRTSTLLWSAGCMAGRRFCGCRRRRARCCGRNRKLPGEGTTMTNVEPTMRIYSGPLSMFGAKAEIAAREKQLIFELIMVPFVSAYEPKHPEVVRINPKQQVPVLVHGDLEIFDSTQIFEYLEDLKPMPELWPSGPASRERARLLELKSDEVFFAHIVRLMNLQKIPDAVAAAAAQESAFAYYREMETLLSDRQFLAGSFSYADIAFYLA